MTSQRLCGGWSEWKEADEEVKGICEKVKHEAESKENSKFSVYTPLNYRSQVVAGANYEIKDTCLPGLHPETREIMTFQMLCGGWTEWKESDGELKRTCEKVKHEAEVKENAKFPVYNPLNYRSQVVAGANCEIKVYVGNDSCLFLKAFQGLGPKAEVSIKSTAMLPMPRIITH